MADYDISNFLNEMAGMGVFAYVLPFLLVFAIVFGLLTTLKIFKDNKAVNAIIAIAVGLLSLQYDMVRDFSASIFPRFGVGVIILLVILILIGLFIDPSKAGYQYAFLGITGIIVITVLVNTAEDLNWAGGWWEQHWTTIIVAGFVLLFVALVITYNNKPSDPKTVFGRLFDGG